MEDCINQDNICDNNCCSKNSSGSWVWIILIAIFILLCFCNN